MFRSRFSMLVFGLAVTTCAVSPVLAAPAVDPDYETIGTSPHPIPSVPSAPGNPSGFNTSPLVISEKTTVPRPRLRFVMRDGTVLVGQVLAFDGQMYALRLPHSTLLVRKDFFASIGPVTPPTAKRVTVHPASGPRA